ncbi:XdhC family protein [Rhizobium lusitanum]|uniref:XdhC family protein n=1 Tax=Rhizobium lusitanum TaxID=293958 RepID=UPI0015718EC0|nr:XdhC family protein [Rhizobium lusitanum]NTJ11579.1 XdhC family protein [Rhizobium lusitanum]
MRRSPLAATPAVPYRAITTDDAEAIVRYAVGGVELDRGAALVTLVEVRGGAARALGAQMAVRGDGGYCGYVSGGCTEAAVAAEAVEAIQRGTDRYLQLGDGSRFFDIVLPCGGGITVAIHVIKKPEPLRRILSCLASRQRVSLCYHPGEQSIAATTELPPRGAAWNGQLFIRPYKPRIRLILCGRGIEIVAAKRLSEASEFEVLTFDDGPGGFDADDLDQDTAVGLLFHDLDQELPLLRRSLEGSPFYIGALGSRRTHEKRCVTLWALGFTKADTDRIKAPIGMFGPARNANTLALSVISDVAVAHSAGP